MMRPQAMRSEAWLEIANGEAWLSGKPVLRNLNLKLWLGESTTILGPNGAGKSSLVKLIDRSLHPIVRPQAELRLFGQTNVKLWDLRQRIGVVTTELEGRFPPSAAAREVVSSGYFGSMRLGRDQLPTAEQHQRCLTLLERLGLGAIAEQPYGSLSDGQRRRLMIARALVHEPEVLVLDEPSRALDLKACHQLIACLRQLCRQGTTVLQVTHRIDTIIPEMGRVLFLRDGSISADGPPQSMLTGNQLSDLFSTPLSVVESGGFRQVLPQSSDSDALTSDAW